VSYLIKTVLVVGLGSIGIRYIEILKNLFPEINIVVLRHKQCKKGDISKFGLSDCVTSIEEAILCKPQAAIIANPATNHLEVAFKLAYNGINLLIEKPISESSKGVESLINICRQNNCICMVGYNLRFLPSLLEFRKKLNENRIGDVYSVRSEVGQYLPNWRPNADYTHGVSAKRSLGGGVLLELSHEIDYLQWVFGEINWVKAHKSKQSDLNIDVEDSANVIFGIMRGKGVELTGSLNMDFIRHDTTRKCFAIGEKGTLLWDGVAGLVTCFDKGDNEWKTIFSSKPSKNFTYVSEIKSFFSSIETNQLSYATGEDGLKVISIVEAIHKSSESNSVVFI
jgi:predicted dehydrogenase